MLKQVQSNADLNVLEDKNNCYIYIYQFCMFGMDNNSHYGPD